MLEELIASHIEGRSLAIESHLLGTSEVFTRMWIASIPRSTPLRPFTYCGTAANGAIGDCTRTERHTGDHADAHGHRFDPITLRYTGQRALPHTLDTQGA